MPRIGAIAGDPGKWIGVIILVALYMFQPASAFAHASLLASDPPTGAIVSDALNEVVLTFSEPASALAVKLLDDAGATTPLDSSASSVGNRIVVSLPPHLTSGTHVLVWRAASSDGHPISGSVVFSIGSASETRIEESAEGPGRLLLWLARATMLITLLLGAGSSGFRMVAEALPVPARRVALLALGIGGIAAIASVPLHGLDALGRPLSDIGMLEVWAVTMKAGYGASVVAALIAMILASISIAARKPSLASWISILSLAAIGLTASMSGHASSADPRWLTRSMIFVHVVCIAWWAGELLPLAVILRQGHAISDPPLLRFSRFIPFVIAPLLVSGITLAVVQLGPPSAAWLTPYAYLFAAKLILLSVLFAVASWNRWYLTDKVMSGEAAATRHLRGAIGLEVVLIMVIVGVAAGWRFTPPPRAVAVQLQSDATAGLVFPKSELLGTAKLAPAKVGENTVTVRLTTVDGQAAEVKSLRVWLSNKELSIPKIDVTGELTDVGIWKSQVALVPASGTWTITVEVRISEFVQARGSNIIDIN